MVQYTYGGSSTNDEWQLSSIGSGYYRIINRNSSKDMVVLSASTSDGAAIIQYTYGGSTTNDEWQLVNNGNGYYRIVNWNSGKVVEVAGSATTDGAAVQQNTWNGGENQQYLLESLGAARISTTEASPVIPMHSVPLSFPNPVSGAVNIQVNLETDGPASLTVFDITGRQVCVLVNSYLPKGRHTVLFDKKELPAGVYVLKLAQKGKLVTRQLVKQ